MYPYHHPHAQRILELPVYRCTEEQYYREQKASYESAAKQYQQMLQRAGPDMLERVAQEMKAFRIRWKIYPWDFNEVVGWIRLYARAESIGASLFLVTTKISKTMSRKKFGWDSSNFLEILISKNQTSADIFEHLRSSIIVETLRRFRGKRYVDTGVLDVFGPHLDWVLLTRRTASAFPMKEQEKSE
jgi:hypothetical protein